MENVLLMFVAVLLMMIFFFFGFNSGERDHSRRIINRAKAQNNADIRREINDRKPYIDIAEGYANMATGGAFAKERLDRRGSR